MKENYSSPVITDSGETNDPDGLFPVVAASAKAATHGYSVGKAVRKVFGAEFSPSSSIGLVKRKEFND